MILGATQVYILKNEAPEVSPEVRVSYLMLSFFTGLFGCSPRHFPGIKGFVGIHAQPQAKPGWLKDSKGQSQP